MSVTLPFFVLVGWVSWFAFQARTFFELASQFLGHLVRYGREETVLPYLAPGEDILHRLLLYYKWSVYSLAGILVLLTVMNSNSRKKAWPVLGIVAGLGMSAPLAILSPRVVADRILLFQYMALSVLSAWALTRVKRLRRSVPCISLILVGLTFVSAHATIAREYLQYTHPWELRGAEFIRSFPVNGNATLISSDIATLGYVQFAMDGEYIKEDLLWSDPYPADIILRSYRQDLTKETAETWYSPDEIEEIVKREHTEYNRPYDSGWIRFYSRLVLPQT